MNSVLEAISTVATRLAVSDMICDCKRLGWSASVLLLLVCMDLTSGQGRERGSARRSAPSATWWLFFTRGGSLFRKLVDESCKSVHKQSVYYVAVHTVMLSFMHTGGRAQTQLLDIVSSSLR